MAVRKKRSKAGIFVALGLLLIAGGVAAAVLYTNQEAATSPDAAPVAVVAPTPPPPPPIDAAPVIIDAPVVVDAAVVAIVEDAAAPTPTPTPKAPEVIAPTLTAKQIEASISKVRGKVLACGGKFPMDGPIHIALAISPDGRVSKATADGPEAIVNSCVERAITGAKFAKTQKGGTTTATFQFHAPQPPPQNPSPY